MSRPASPVKFTINDVQYRIWVPTILKVLVTSSITVSSTNGTNVQQFAGTAPLEVLGFMLRITTGEYLVQSMR